MVSDLYIHFLYIFSTLLSPLLRCVFKWEELIIISVYTQHSLIDMFDQLKR